MRLTILLLLAIFVSGCTSTLQKSPPVIPNWSQHVSQLGQLDQWTLEGKLGYQDSKDGGSAWLNWEQHQQTFDVSLTGPFGAGATQITGSNQYAQLQRAGHDNITARSPAELTELLFGWQWPVEQLQYWVRGSPFPLTPETARHHNPDGTLKILEQSNWTLQFSNYHKIGPWILPSKIKGQNGDYRFTLVIKNWNPSLPQ
jgi:outer membrane lipoprotein LolB